ncbi:hypothetical protein DERP_015045 [Dermatophagoides pteronyssinus]|uniref:Uncharacterized protein n=1 Tax=Dermatophagoides pteronyssinus TaxID=6956 RepID=A0ABQ8JCX7_DERPT|nr:hypothetical protein DERP_015045 [Dermatophagoides pteronyssinus]
MTDSRKYNLKSKLQKESRICWFKVDLLLLQNGTNFDPDILKTTEIPNDWNFLNLLEQVENQIENWSRNLNSFKLCRSNNRGSHLLWIEYFKFIQ